MRFAVYLSVCLCSFRFGMAEPQALGPEVGDFIQRYCLDCHNDDKEKGDRSFESLLNHLTNPEESYVLEEIVDLLNLGDMPPDEEDVLQPSSAERNEIIDTITAYLLALEESRSPAETILRRLTRYEYKNTMRDLLGVVPEVMDATKQFPADQETHGFTNVGARQALSQHQLSLYLRAARTYLDSALVFGEEEPQTRSWRFGPEDFTKDTRGNATIKYRVLDETGKFFDIGHGEPADRRPNAPLNFANEGVPASGYYKISIVAEAVGRHNPYDPEVLELDLTSPLKLGVWHVPEKRFLQKSSTEGRHLVEVFDLLDNEPSTFETTTWMPEGSIPFINYINGPGAAKGILNRVIKAYHPYAKIPGNADIDRMKEQGIPLPEKQINPETRVYISQFYVGPRVRVYEVKLEGPFFEKWPPAGHRSIFGDITDARKVDIPAALTGFASKAFRRPTPRTEMEHHISYVQDRIEAGTSHEEAIKAGMAAILVSPRFLFLDEGDLESSPKLDGFELATRLSYALWASMPDDELFDLAASGQLLNQKTLLAQVERLLNDPRASEFSRRFPEAWLRLDKIGTMPPSGSQYPSYYADRLEPAMKKETSLLFSYILDNNLPVTEFIDGSSTFVNDALAQHYGLEGEFGERFQRVEMPKSKRRSGLLGHASVLTATANGVETSPVVRGVWILENILGTPPSPPPPDVPPIEPDTRGATTIREQLAKHREIETCADCHSKIDPWGFGLEHYDPVGGFRDRYTVFYGEGRISKQKPGRIVEGSAKLPSGHLLEDERDLKQALVERKDLFARNLVSKLLMYSTGRELTFRDRIEVDEIVERVKENGYGFRDLLSEVFASSIFQSR